MFNCYARKITHDSAKIYTPLDISKRLSFFYSSLYLLLIFSWLFLDLFGLCRAILLRSSLVEARVSPSTWNALILFIIDFFFFFLEDLCPWLCLSVPWVRAQPFSVFTILSFSLISFFIFIFYSYFFNVALFLHSSQHPSFLFQLTH